MRVSFQSAPRVDGKARGTSALRWPGRLCRSEARLWPTHRRIKFIGTHSTGQAALSASFVTAFTPVSRVGRRRAMSRCGTAHSAPRQSAAARCYCEKPVTARPKARLLARSQQGFHSPSDGRENRPVCLAESVACRVPAHSAVDSKRAVSDRDRMIRASAALYYWFGFPTISAEGRMRVI